MDIRQISGSAVETKADLVVFCVYGNPAQDPLFKSVDSALKGLLKTIAKEQDFTGKSGQSISVRTNGLLAATNVAVLGIGDQSSSKLADTRDHAARAAGIGQRLGATSVCFVIPAVGEEQTADALQLAVEGAILGTYKFDKYRTKERKPSSVKRFNLLVPESKRSAAATRALKAALDRGKIVGEAICHARDYVNEPAAYMTPSQLASEARSLARKHGLSVKILGRKQCEELGMGMFLAVAQGSAQEPKLIHLTYTPKGKPASKIALIGKGVMFDSGGYSLKPSNAMEDMKIDMSGAAAVISAMAAIAQIGSKHEVHAIAACCENMVSGHAFKLGDVLKSMDGATVEINNTDAEGRLTLGDAITYARTKIKPDEMIDFATLTGACMIALGPTTAGVMSDTEDMVERWLAAAERAGEDMWRLPLNKRLKAQLKSSIADMRNTGERFGGAITAGLFLQHFAKDNKWIHVDIAGPASSNRAKDSATPRGGTGFAVSSIIEYVTR